MKKVCNHSFVHVSSQWCGISEHNYQECVCSKCGEIIWQFMYDSSKGETYMDKQYVGKEAIQKACVEHNFINHVYYPRG